MDREESKQEPAGSQAAVGGTGWGASAGLLGTELCTELSCSRAKTAGSKWGEKEHFLVSDLAGKELALNLLHMVQSSNVSKTD